KRGDLVKAGQIIGRDDEGISSPIHASVNGSVEAIKRVEHFGKKMRYVSIVPDGTSDWQALEGHSTQWTELPAEQIEELLYLSGVSALGSSGIPTRHNSSIVPPTEVKHIIVHHTDAEIFHASLPLLLKKERLEHFVQGLLMLKSVMPEAKLHLALSYQSGTWLDAIGEQLHEQEDVFYYIVRPKYPQQLDALLLSGILKKKLPYGCLPANIGALTLNVQDVLHVYDAVANGKPLFEKPLALSGPGFEKPSHLQVKIGTPLEELLVPRVKKDVETRFVLNSLMCGKAVDETRTPVCRDDHQIIAIPEARDGELLSFMLPGLRKDSYSNTFLSLALPFLPLLSHYFKTIGQPKKKVNTSLNGEGRGCISCGFCSNACPVGLYPNLLHRYIEREKFVEAPVRYGIFDCIDCNLCSYVCPSKVPVAELITSGKKKLLEEGFHPPQGDEFFAEIQELDAYRGMP
ncbi:MAG: 4Fe-4S dicluster domain-containing protein, partial [bacterium]|nr:4Fe-4S dicluster domain-containing protein [bacterium]